MRLENPIKNCKICFKPIQNRTIFNMVNRDVCICESCFNMFTPQFITFYHGQYKCLAIFNYDEQIKTYLYQLKGCYDFELAEMFIFYWRRELRLKYFGYTIIPIPSYEREDQKREFNHVVEIFKCLKLPMLKILKKTENIKQANLKKKDRKNIAKYLELSNLETIRNKKILIVDDVYTTGSTIDAAIKLIKKGKPRDIKVLVLSKRNNN